MSTCASCGVLSDYVYCERCETERNDPSVKPLVWQYIGGVLGSLPNRRSIQYVLSDLGFTEVGMVHGLRCFTRRPDGEPTGTIAVLTRDGYMVVLNGKYELDSLMTHPCGFAKTGMLDDLPRTIESMYPENYALAMKAKGKTK